MKIKIICVGKLKEKYLKQGIDEYTKRLSRFANIEVIEIIDEKIPENASESICKKIKQTEGNKILSKVSDGEFVISMCIEGNQCSSEKLAHQISRIMMTNSTIDFIIGGSLGLSDDVKSRSDLKLSFSECTFPHQLMRLILFEQIYRCFKINNNEQYHK